MTDEANRRQVLVLRELGPASRSHGTEQYRLPLLDVKADSPEFVAIEQRLADPQGLLGRAGELKPGRRL